MVHYLLRLRFQKNFIPNQIFEIFAAFLQSRMRPQNVRPKSVNARLNSLTPGHAPKSDARERLVSA